MRSKRQAAEDLCDSYHPDQEKNTGEQEYVCDANWAYCTDTMWNPDLRSTQQWRTRCCKYPQQGTFGDGICGWEGNRKYRPEQESQACRMQDIIEIVSQQDARESCFDRVYNGGTVTKTKGSSEGSSETSGTGIGSIITVSRSETKINTNSTGEGRSTTYKGTKSICEENWYEREDQIEDDRLECHNKKKGGSK